MFTTLGLLLSVLIGSVGCSFQRCDEGAVHTTEPSLHDTRRDSCFDGSRHSSVQIPGDAGLRDVAAIQGETHVHLETKDPDAERADLRLSGVGFDAWNRATLRLGMAGGGTCGRGVTTIEGGRFRFVASSSLEYGWYTSLVLYIDENDTGACDEGDAVWSSVTSGITEDLDLEITPSEWKAGKGRCEAFALSCQ